MDGNDKYEENMEIIFINTQTQIFINESAIQSAPIKRENGGIK